MAYSSNYHDLLVQCKARLIVSYGRKHGDSLEVYLPPGFNEYLLDSGGFQIHFGTQERDVNIRGYTLWVQFILDKYGDKVKGFMGLDNADWESSLDNYEYMRKEGLTSIPVWKAFWPEQVLDFLCSEYDYVAVGGVAFGASKQVLRHVFERVVTNHPKTKLHMLGVGIRGGVAFQTFRPYSVDVSTWSVPARFGHDIILDKKQVLKEVKLPDELRQRMRDDKSYEDAMILKAIKLMQSLETELDNFHEPHQMLLV